MAYTIITICLQVLFLHQVSFEGRVGFGVRPQEAGSLSPESRDQVHLWRSGDQYYKN